MYRQSVDRTSLLCAWLEAFHKQIYDQGGSPQVLNRNPLQTQGLPQPELCTCVCMFVQPGRLPTSRITTREAANKQNHDHGAYVPTSRIATRGLPGWLVGWLASGITYDQGTCHALGWLSGWLGGWLAGWLRRLEAPHKQIYMRPGRAPHKVFFGTREEAAVDCMVGRLCVCM